MSDFAHYLHYWELYYYNKQCEIYRRPICLNYNKDSRGCPFGKKCWDLHMCLFCGDNHTFFICPKNKTFNEEWEKWSQLYHETTLDILFPYVAINSSSIWWKSIDDSNCASEEIEEYIGTTPIDYKIILQGSNVVFPLELRDTDYVRRVFLKLLLPLNLWLEIINHSKLYLEYLNQTFETKNKYYPKVSIPNEDSSTMYNGVSENDILNIFKYMKTIKFPETKHVFQFRYAVEQLAYFRNNEMSHSLKSNAFDFLVELSVLLLESMRSIHALSIIDERIVELLALQEQYRSHYNYKIARCKETENLVDFTDLMTIPESYLQRLPLSDCAQIPYGKLKVVCITKDDGGNYDLFYPFEMTNQDYIWLSTSILAEFLNKKHTTFEWGLLSSIARWYSQQSIAKLFDLRKLRNAIAHQTLGISFDSNTVRDCIQSCYEISEEKMLQSLMDQFSKHKRLRRKIIVSSKIEIDNEQNTYTVLNSIPLVLQSDYEVLLKSDLFPPLQFDSKISPSSLFAIVSAIPSVALAIDVASAVDKRVDWEDFVLRFKRYQFNEKNGGSDMASFQIEDSGASDSLKIELEHEINVLNSWLGNGTRDFLGQFAMCKLVYSFLEKTEIPQSYVYCQTSKSTVEKASCIVRYRLDTKSNSLAHLLARNKCYQGNFDSYRGHAIQMNLKYFKDKTFRKPVGGIPRYMKLASHSNMICSLLILQVNHIQQVKYVQFLDSVYSKQLEEYWIDLLRIKLYFDDNFHSVEEDWDAFNGNVQDILQKHGKQSEEQETIERIKLKIIEINKNADHVKNYGNFDIYGTSVNFVEFGSLLTKVYEHEYYLWAAYANVVKISCGVDRIRYALFKAMK